MAHPMLPSARLVRQAGAAVSPPPVPLRHRIARAAEPLKIALGYAVAFWPLTAIVLFGAAMIFAVSANSGP